MPEWPEPLSEVVAAGRRRLDAVDWRRYGRLAVLALTVVAFAAGGVQLADPFRDAPDPPRVDTTAPPARIAYQAMRGTEGGSYVYERYLGNDTERRQVMRFRVDRDDGQFRGNVSFTASTRPQLVYASDAGTWRRTDAAGSTWEQSALGSPRVDLFHSVSAVLDDGADVSLVERNATTVVVRVDDTDTALLLAKGWENYTAERPEARASLTLAVDRETGRLRWSRIRWSVPTDEEDGRVVHVSVQRFSRWGAVDVQPPRGLPYTFDAVLFDLVDYCPDCGGDGS